jgi:hypothetical protein
VDALPPKQVYPLDLWRHFKLQSSYTVRIFNNPHPPLPFIPYISELALPTLSVVEIADTGGTQTLFDGAGKQYGSRGHISPVDNCNAKRVSKDDGLEMYKQEGQNAGRVLVGQRNR